MNGIRKWKRVTRGRQEVHGEGKGEERGRE